MREILIVIGLVITAVALRSARGHLARKLGAVVMLAATFALVYFLTGNAWVGALGAGAWILLPWVELLLRIRTLRLPLNQKLQVGRMPSPSFFPNATEAATAMEEAGFDHVSDCGWEWAGTKQFFRLFWHPEERAVSAVCLCEQSDVAFAFVSISSQDSAGTTWRTTNFPFAPTLRCLPNIRWNHVPCERSCFHQILKDHHVYLGKQKVATADLRMPDPEEIEAQAEAEMRQQIDHNLAAGIIQLTGDGHFRYTTRGMFFLWGQFLKDMIRFC